MKGKFITFEGSEGSGKSTQSALLAKYLKQKGYKVLMLREPGSTKISEAIRDILLDYKNDSLSDLCETMLYMASRAQLVKQVIKPALKQGKIIICDRFLDSTIAYQGYGLGIDINTIKHIGAFVNQGVKPDLTIFLDIAIKKGLKHRRLTKDRIERRPLSYHQRVRNGYLGLAKQEPRRIKIIKVASHKAITQLEIRKLIDRLFRLR